MRRGLCGFPPFQRLARRCLLFGGKCEMGRANSCTLQKRKPTLGSDNTVTGMRRNGEVICSSNNIFPEDRGINYFLCRRFGNLRETIVSEEEKGRSSRGVVAVGMSGGVDSSVAALLLQRQGYKVFGLYMRNWDSRDEAGGGNCTADEDFQDAEMVCKDLGIELFEVDYQKRYWIEVFENFTEKFAMGFTPNPDLACNQCIKFDALLEHAVQMGADKLATGHYARLHRPLNGGNVELLRGADHHKDQSYFLASVGAAALERVLFPVGSLLKSEVRKLAVAEGLKIATKRSSAGICFVGRRHFRDFISEYVEMNPGPFVSVYGQTLVSIHEGIAAYTHGQRAGISGVPEAFYVVGKDVPNNIVFVAPGADHPALFCTTAVADSPFWISGEAPKALQDGRPLTCMFKARYRQQLEECVVSFSDSTHVDAINAGMGLVGTQSVEFAPSTFCRLQKTTAFDAMKSSSLQKKQQLQVRFATPARAVTPGQALVLYDGDVCLGASILSHPGPSLFEQELRQSWTQHQTVLNSMALA